MACGVGFRHPLPRVLTTAKVIEIMRTDLVMGKTGKTSRSTANITIATIAPITKSSTLREIPKGGEGQAEPMTTTATTIVTTIVIMTTRGDLHLRTIIPHRRRDIARVAVAGRI